MKNKNVISDPPRNGYLSDQAHKRSDMSDSRATGHLAHAWNQRPQPPALTHHEIGKEIVAFSAEKPDSRQGEAFSSEKLGPVVQNHELYSELFSQDAAIQIQDAGQHDRRLHR